MLQVIKNTGLSVVVSCVYNELFYKINELRESILGVDKHLWLSFEHAVWADWSFNSGGQSWPRGAMTFDIQFDHHNPAYQDYWGKYSRRVGDSDSDSSNQYWSYSALVHDAGRCFPLT